MRTLTPAAEAAKSIRVILKEKFPQIKFKVVSSNFSMGDSVRVSWIDGPARNEVEKLTGHFQYGHFDGMIDLYEATNIREDIPQTKFLHLERTISDEVYQKSLQSINEIYHQNKTLEDQYYDNPGTFATVQNIIYRILQEKDITNFQGLKRTAETCGSINEFFEVY